MAERKKTPAKKVAAKAAAQPEKGGVLVSMTGFARSQGESEGLNWAWEVRSVNGKGRDVRLRLPPGFEGLDGPVREAISAVAARGNVTANLNITQGAAQGARLAVNAEALAQILTLVPHIQKALPDATPPSVDGILGLKGVLESVDESLDEDGRGRLEAAVLTGLDEALSAFAIARREEGGRLQAVLLALLADLSAHGETAAGLAALRPEAVRERIRIQVADLLGKDQGLTEDRLAQEVALLMVKGDVREELDRLRAHVAQAHDLLAAREPVGRRLDFLCQEFNREANTLCSKSSDVELTRTGLAMKAIIEQFREQVQNIE
ncbi:MAG: YicC/YloC family endoribonuclease [Rhodospirillales bacterium]